MDAKMKTERRLRTNSSLVSVKDHFEDRFVHLTHISTRRSKKIDAHVWVKSVFWHLLCIRVSLLQTDACNIISRSILQAYLYNRHTTVFKEGVGGGGSFSTVTHGTLMESYSVTVSTTT